MGLGPSCYDLPIPENEIDLYASRVSIFAKNTMKHTKTYFYIRFPYRYYTISHETYDRSASDYLD